MADLPLTYPDLVCILDLDPFASETTSDLQTLSQDVLHLLLELPGSNPDDLTRGVGIMMYLSGTSADFARIPGLIDSQLRDDDRIQDSHTTLEPLPEGKIRVNIQVTVSGTVVPLTYLASSTGVTTI